MRKLLLLEMAAIGLAALTLGAGCPTLPKIQKRVVELAVGASSTVPLEARGRINGVISTASFDIHDYVDISSILEGSGVDVSDVSDVKLSAISYRVTRPDPTSTRAISGTLTIARPGVSGPVTLASGITGPVNSLTSFQTAPLTAAGVNVLNGLLHDLLVEAQTHTPALNTQINYEVDGTSTPSDVDTDFDWELKIDLSIKGKTKEITVLG